MSKVSVFMFLFVFSWISAARGEDPNTGSEVILQAQDCPALFGDEESQKLNAEERESCLDSIEVCDYTINLLHHGDWTEPTPISLTGLELEDIDCPEGLDDEEGSCESMVHLRLTEEMEGVDCPTGLYSLHVDDSLGEDGRVIAILPNLLLMELQGRLHYLPMDSFQKPIWRIIWRSPWKLMRLPGQRSSSSGRANTHRRNSRSRRKHR